ncbi:MAG: ACP S-malonyltransferase [Oligoflexales bacterium]|nr:ACP S-malonyltransferase [Oligoflexales bacterium]
MSQLEPSSNSDHYSSGEPRLTLAMFPGQGSQYLGMGKELFDNFPIAREVFEEASQALGQSMTELCFNSSDSELATTTNTQPSLLTCSVAAWRVIQAETGFVPDFFAGHSLGEYSALVAAGRLDLNTAVKTVRKRADAMQKAVPQGLGAMAAVLKCPADVLNSLCLKASTETEFVEIANYNNPQQLVVAGHKKAVDLLLEELKSQRIIAKLLPVSAPFHCRLMEPARQEMTPVLMALPFKNNGTKIVANVSGKIEENYHAGLLIEQITKSVLWTQSMELLANQSCQNFIEVGPGKVLSGLIKRIKEDALVYHSDDLKGLLAYLSNKEIN